MPIPAYNTRILVDAFDLSGHSNSLRLAVDSQSIEYNVFQSPAKQFIAGNPASTLEHDGYYELPGQGNIEREMFDRLGAGVSQVAAILGTNQTVPVGYVIPTSYNELLNIDSPVSELITVKGRWSVGSGRLYRGYQLSSGGITAPIAKPAVDFGSAGVAGGKAWLFWRGNIGAFTNAAVTIQTDDAVGFASPTNKGTFTFSSTGAHALEINLSTALEQFVRINVTDLGGATSFQMTVIAGVSGVTY